MPTPYDRFETIDKGIADLKNDVAEIAGLRITGLKNDIYSCPIFFFFFRFHDSNR